MLKMRDSGDVDGLLAALHHSNMDVRHYAAARLGEIGEPRAFDPILAMLKDAPQRPGIVNVLGQLSFQMKTRGFKPDPKAVPHLLALLDEPEVRENAVFALGQFDDPRVAAALGIPSDQAAIEALIAGTQVADAQKRLDATFKLRQDGVHVNNPALRAKIVEAFLALINLPPSNEYGPSRYQAATALGDMGDRRAVEPLISILKDPGWMIRSEAAISLGKLKDRKAIPALEALLSHPDDATRDSARKALAALRG